MYSVSEIKEAILCYIEVLSFRKAEALLNISKSTLHRWWHRFGKLVRCPKRKGKRKKQARKPFIARKHKTLDKDVLDLVTNKAFTSVSQIQAELPYQVSLTTIRRSLKRNKVKCKKVHCRLIPNHETLDAKKANFFDFVKDKAVQTDEVVCLDEVGFSSVSNNLRAYYPVGVCKTLIVPKRVKRSCIAAISNSGLVLHESQVSAYNSESFLAFLKDLVKHLKPNHKYLLMDNGRFHHKKDCLDFLLQHNLEPLFIPPYSPEYNPIEEVFSLVKRNFRNLLLSGVSLPQAMSSSFDQISNNLEGFYKRSSMFWSRVKEMKTI